MQTKMAKKCCFIQVLCVCVCVHKNSATTNLPRGSTKIKKKNFRYYFLSLFSFYYYQFRYRFVELYYRRVECVRKGRIIPAKTQTVVIFLPDVRSCLPTRVEWDELAIKYKRRLDFELKKQSNGGSDDSESNKKDSSKADDSSINCSNSIEEIAENDTNDANGNQDDNKNQCTTDSVGEDSATTASASASAIEKALHYNLY